MLCSRCQKELEQVRRSSVSPDSVYFKKPGSEDGWDSRTIYTMACRNCGLLEEFVKWENTDYK
jgi:hypothetical protein